MEDLRLPLTDDVWLRPVRAEDVDELYVLTVANRAHLSPWMPWAIDAQREGTQAFVDGALAQRARDDGFQAVIVKHATIIGSMGFHRIDWVNRATSIGYWIAAMHQGAGIVTAGVGALVDHAFAVWDLHRIEIAAAPENRRSRAVAERLGFREEGLRREAERHGDRYRDLVLFGLLSSDPRS